VPDVRIHKTKKIRPLSKTRSGGEIISPTRELRRLKEGHFLIVDDEESRHHMLTAATRLNINVQTRRCAKGYEVHRVAKPVPVIYDYPI
jgi:hypothetical protein